MTDFDVAPVVLLLRDDLVDAVRHRLHSGKELRFLDAVVLQRDRANLERDVWILHCFLHPGRLFDPSQHRFLIECVTTGEVEDDAIGWTLRLGETEAHQCDRCDDDEAFHWYPPVEAQRCAPFRRKTSLARPPSGTANTGASSYYSA